jgi:hypothetical protein
VRPLIGAALCLPLLLSAPPALAEASLATYFAVRDGLVAVWDDLPLTVYNAALVTETPKGFGQYERRAGKAYRPDEPVIVYAELYGYAVGQPANGGYLRGLSADLALLDTTGAVRANQVGFWSESERFDTRPLEMHLSFSATLSAFEPGDYTLRFTVRDGEAETSFDLPITLMAAE